MGGGSGARHRGARARPDRPRDERAPFGPITDSWSSSWRDEGLMVVPLARSRTHGRPVGATAHGCGFWLGLRAPTAAESMNNRRLQVPRSRRLQPKPPATPLREPPQAPARQKRHLESSDAPNEAPWVCFGRSRRPLARRSRRSANLAPASALLFRCSEATDRESATRAEHGRLLLRGRLDARHRVLNDEHRRVQTRVLKHGASATYAVLGAPVRLDPPAVRQRNRRLHRDAGFHREHRPCRSWKGEVAA